MTWLRRMAGWRWSIAPTSTTGRPPSWRSRSIDRLERRGTSPIVHHVVDQPVFLRLRGGEEAVALHVLVDLGDVLAAVLGVELLEPLRIERVSRAWISMSLDCPSKPPEGWWLRIRALGSAIRLPGVPPARISEPIDIATPKQIVCTSQCTNCMVS